MQWFQHTLELNLQLKGNTSIAFYHILTEQCTGIQWNNNIIYAKNRMLIRVYLHEMNDILISNATKDRNVPKRKSLVYDIWTIFSPLSRLVTWYDQAASWAMTINNTHLLAFRRVNDYRLYHLIFKGSLGLLIGVRWRAYASAN